MTDPLASGSRLAGRYTVGATLRTGLHDHWYRAKSDAGQAVLINVFTVPHHESPTGGRIRQAFARNASLLARLQHPQISRVIDIIDGSALQLVVVEDQLRSTLARAKLAEASARQQRTTAEQAFGALAAAHGQALLHTRLSPAALWFGTPDQPVLGFFDLAARALMDEREDVVYDPQYSAPELLAGGRPTPQADLYALGATLLEAVSGKTMPPASARQQGVPLPVCVGADPALVAALHECLELDPSRRAVSATEVLEQLRRVAVAPVVVPPPPTVSAPAVVTGPEVASTVAGPLPPAPPAARPARQGVWLGAVLGLALLGGVVVMFGRAGSEAGAGTTGTGAAEATGTQVQAPDPAVSPASGSDTSSAASTTPATAPSPVERVPLEITQPLPNTSQDSGAFVLSGTGTPGQTVNILEDGVVLGQTELGTDGSWAYQVPSPAAGKHMYSVGDPEGTLLARLPLTVLAPQPVQATADPPDTAEPQAPQEVIEDSEIETLVDAYMSYGSADDVGSAMNLYADQVDYFGRGVQPKSVLYDDKRNYFVRWPKRAYERTTEVTTLGGSGRTRQVRFDYRYDIQRPDKEFWGTAYTVLKLVKQDGRVLITGEQGAIYPETQHKRTLGAVPLSTTPPGQTGATGAPTFDQWYFTTCQDTTTGEQQTGLRPGRLQRCQLVIETTPNGAEPVSALFTYELEYEENGQTQKFAVDAPDRWPSAGEPATTYERDGDSLVFTLPLAVKDRADRQYTNINAIGEITFDNGSRKKVYEQLPIVR